MVEQLHCRVAPCLIKLAHTRATAPHSQATQDADSSERKDEADMLFTEVFHPFSIDGLIDFSICCFSLRERVSGR